MAASGPQLPGYAFIPPRPAVRPEEMWHGSPYLLSDKGRYSIGWQDWPERKGGPAFVTVRVGVFGTLRIVRRYPLTDEGWAQAWQAFVQLDAAAAARTVPVLIARAQEDLDTPCRQLLRRAQHAIATILRYGTYASVSGTAIPESVLRQHEWEITHALRDISQLQAEHESRAHPGQPGPMTAVILSSHQRALTLAREATAARVGALERYAAQVDGVESARRDWERAMSVAGLNDKYLDLVARTAADQHAIAEITGVTEQAAAAARAFYETVQEAHLAAEALVLPPPRG